MLRTAAICLLLAGAAVAQSTPSAPVLKPRPTSAPQVQTSPAATPPAAASATAGETSSVAPDAPVITVQGLCQRPGGSSATPADCKTVITRAEFEKVANAVQPNMPPAAKKQFASRYVAALYLAEKAHELGLDKGSDFDQRMYVARLQVLASLGGEQVHKQATNVSDGEIETYYHDHISDFKTISFERIRVPKQKQVDASSQKPNDPDLQKKREASQAEMKAEADKLRARAANGEDFAKLQQEAYDFGGYNQIKGSNPRGDKVRKAGVLPADASIFELKSGEVSQVFNDPSEFVVYKVEAVEDMPLATVHDEISRKLATDREKGALESLQNSTKLDDAYFATPAPPAPPTLRNPGEAAPAPTPTPGKK